MVFHYMRCNDFGAYACSNNDKRRHLAWFGFRQQIGASCNICWRWHPHSPLPLRGVFLIICGMCTGAACLHHTLSLLATDASLTTRRTTTPIACFHALRIPACRL